MKTPFYLLVHPLCVALLCLLILQTSLYAQAPIEEELKALERQIEQQEAEQAKARSKAAEEAKLKVEEEARHKAERERLRSEEEQKRKLEEEIRGKLEEKQRLAAEEEKKKEEKARKRAEEEKRLLELEKAEQQKEKNITTQAILGKWETDYGTVVFRGTDNGQIDGKYSYFFSDGRITGSLEGDALSGFWSQNGGLKSCSEARKDTTYWGHLIFQFINDYTEFIGKWGYCDDELNNIWNGKKI
jgi:Na+-transporting NADH:ubiquinone oxidoreductase subunit NqrC